MNITFVTSVISFILFLETIVGQGQVQPRNSLQQRQVDPQSKSHLTPHIKYSHFQRISYTNPRYPIQLPFPFHRATAAGAGSYAQLRWQKPNLYHVQGDPELTLPLFSSPYNTARRAPIECFPPPTSACKCCCVSMVMIPVPIPPIIPIICCPICYRNMKEISQQEQEEGGNRTVWSEIMKFP